MGYRLHHTRGDIGLRSKAGRLQEQNDKSLHEFLTLELLPKLIDTVSARKKADERAAALEAMPKKRSSRLQVSTQPMCASVESVRNSKWAGISIYVTYMCQSLCSRLSAWKHLLRLLSDHHTVCAGPADFLGLPPPPPKQQGSHSSTAP